LSFLLHVVYWERHHASAPFRSIIGFGAVLSVIVGLVLTALGLVSLLKLSPQARS
jgi:hypothetical protein